jgi:hypothetical protein
MQLFHIGEDAQARLPVVVHEEDFLAIIAALGELVADAGGDCAGDAGLDVGMGKRCDRMASMMSMMSRK